MKKTTFPALAAAAVLLLCPLLMAGGGQAPTEKGESPDNALARNLEIFNAVTRHIARVYVDSLRPDEAFDAAIGGLLYTVDPYTEYYDPEEVESLETMTTGAYGGIGAIVLAKEGDTYIHLPLDGTPSYKAGLRPGDRILRVDTIDVLGKPLDFTTSHLRGDPGTTVTVTVERPYVGPDSILTFAILRERVQDRSVPFYGVVDSVGYIKLTSFMERSAQEVRTALESFKGNPEVKGVVLDLRDNGGGLVNSAVDILGMFLPKGTQVLETRGKTPDSYSAYTTPRSPLMPDIPLAVMINGGSASASEITAGAIQDLDRGVLVGQRSFGKGLVQSTFSLPHNGVLKVTTAKYHLPSGRLIQALDYSHRNPDGSVAPTPDSLTHEFLTRKGRTVKDGGGLVPDSVTEPEKLSMVAYNLLMTNQFFDYATKYASTRPSIAPPSAFTLTDADIDEFVAFVDTTKVKGDNTGERLLEELRKSARNEGFGSEELTARLDSIAPLLAPDLRRDILNRRSEMEEMIGREIVSRYYNRAGQTEYDLRFDSEFETVRRILLDPALYDSLLEPKKDQKPGKPGGGKR